jgi:hypothetical protein
MSLTVTSSWGALRACWRIQIPCLLRMRTRHFVAYQRRNANAVVGIVRRRKPVSASYRIGLRAAETELKNAELRLARKPSITEGIAGVVAEKGTRLTSCRFRKLDPRVSMV